MVLAGTQTFGTSLSRVFPPSRKGMVCVTSCIVSLNVSLLQSRSQTLRHHRRVGRSSGGGVEYGRYCRRTRPKHDAPAQEHCRVLSFPSHYQDTSSLNLHCRYPLFKRLVGLQLAVGPRELEGLALGLLIGVHLMKSLFFQPQAHPDSNIAV